MEKATIKQYRRRWVALDANDVVVDDAARSTSFSTSSTIAPSLAPPCNEFPQQTIPSSSAWANGSAVSAAGE